MQTEAKIAKAKNKCFRCRKGLDAALAESPILCFCTTCRKGICLFCYFQLKYSLRAQGEQVCLGHPKAKSVFVPMAWTGKDKGQPLKFSSFRNCPLCKMDHFTILSLAECIQREEKLQEDNFYYDLTVDHKEKMRKRKTLEFQQSTGKAVVAQWEEMKQIQVEERNKWQKKEQIEINEMKRIEHDVNQWNQVWKTFVFPETEKQVVVTAVSDQRGEENGT